MLVLSSASLPRATLKLWGRGAHLVLQVHLVGTMVPVLYLQAIGILPHHDCLLQVHLVFSPRRDQLGGTPGTTGLPVLHLLDSSQYSICTWLCVAGLYLQWHRCGHHDRIRPSRRTGEADTKWSKYTSFI